MATSIGITYTVAEFNTIITMVGCLCATVQVITGAYAAYKKKKLGLLRSNKVLLNAHHAFGGFATTLYFLGLFAGLTGFIGALMFNIPPFEGASPSFNIHVWPSFAIMVIVNYKTYLSYFNKPAIYKRAKWLGVATFIAWAFTWITSASSYYIRTTPANFQHPPPTYLLPIELLWLQLIMPFLIGGLIGLIILRKADKIEQAKEARLAKKAEQNAQK
jgi:hypothetical protein